MFFNHPPSSIQILGEVFPRYSFLHLLETSQHLGGVTGELLKRHTHLKWEKARKQDGVAKFFPVSMCPLFFYYSPANSPTAFKRSGKFGNRATLATCHRPVASRYTLHCLIKLLPKQAETETKMMLFAKKSSVQSLFLFNVKTASSSEKNKTKLSLYHHPR